MDLKLKNKSVFVSASGQGIGEAIARQFLEEGARVLINDIHKDRLMKVFRKFKNRFHSNVDFVVGDMTNIKNIEEVTKHVSHKWGKLDILVANLGSGKPVGNDRMDVEEWKEFFDVNLYGSIQLIRSLLPQMKQKGKGSIIMISSIAGIQQTSAPLGYAAAKASILTLVKNLSFELAKNNIRVNAVAPGNVFFPAGRWQEIISEKPGIMDNYIKAGVPMGRFGRPEEIASAVVFLASPVSSFTTGACLIVDGGETRKY